MSVSPLYTVLSRLPVGQPLGLFKISSLLLQTHQVLKLALMALTCVQQIFSFLRGHFSQLLCPLLLISQPLYAVLHVLLLANCVKKGLLIMEGLDTEFVYLIALETCTTEQ